MSSVDEHPEWDIKESNLEPAGYEPDALAY